MRHRSRCACSLLKASTLFLLLLTLPSFGQNSPAHQAQLKQDELEMQHHTLTMDEVTRLMKAGHALSEAGKQDPSLAAGVQRKESEDDQQTLDQMNAALSSIPRAVAILHDFGFTPRTFALAELTSIQSGLAAYAIQAGQKEADVVKNMGVNPANIAFIQAHGAEIEQLRKQYPTE